MVADGSWSAVKRCDRYIALNAAVGAVAQRKRPKPRKMLTGRGVGGKLGKRWSQARSRLVAAGAPGRARSLGVARSHGHNRALRTNPRIERLSEVSGESLFRFARVSRPPVSSEFAQLADGGRLLAVMQRAKLISRISGPAH